MPGELTKDLVQRYTQQRENLRKHFLSEKVGKQALYIDQAELFKPIIDSQKETTENIQNKITNNQDLLTNTIVPFTNEIKRRNDQMDELQSLPFYNYPQEIEGLPQSTPIKKSGVTIVDLDGELLNQTHAENLQSLKLDLPSKVQKEGNFAQVFEVIKTHNRIIGQHLGIKSKKTQGEKEIYKSEKETLKIYKAKIAGLEGAAQFIKKTGEGLRKRKLCKQKRGRGRPKIQPDAIVYSTPNDLVQKLYELVIAKAAGNTGLDNIINEMLDELLEKGFIDKKYFNKLYNSIFNINK